MAERYGMLPTQILQDANTFDLYLFLNANIIRTRQEKKARGESINDTYSQKELDSMYHNFKNRNGNESK